MFNPAVMSCRKRGLAVLALRTLLFSLSSAAVVFRDAPEDLVLAAGNTAVLRCSIQAGGGERDPVKWMHLESDQVLSKNGRITTLAQEKYSVVGDHEANGEYHLRIIGVQLTDRGEYRCMCGSEYRSAILTVVVPPDTGYPLCHVQPNPTQQQPGRIAELTCNSHGGTPPAALIWHRKGEPISEVTTHSNALKSLVTAEDNGVVFTCFAKSKAASMPVRRCEVMVLNTPPTGSINPDLHVVYPGDSASYTCTGAGISKVIRYRWLVNFIDVTRAENRGQRYEVLDNNRTLRITDVRRWEDGAVIACDVSIASGLTGRAWAKLSIASQPVTSAANEANPGALFPINDRVPTENDKKKTGPTGLKPQGNTATAGVVAGATMATVGIILALVAIAILLLKIKASGHFSMANANEKKCFPDKLDLSTGTIKKVDECPIYAKPNKVRKGPAPAPPGAAAAVLAACDLAMQKKQLRKNHHSYEKVEILGCSSPGQTYTLPVRLQARAPTTPKTRRSDTLRCIKAQAPLPPNLPPLPRSPLPPLPQKSPLPTPTPSDWPTGDLVYADLDLPAKTETVNQSHPSFVGVDYAMLQGRNSGSSGGYDWGTS
ncbi:uncharacterized protein LOC119738511 [Patiria miniata]|uniref:Ig-like domain-containing protein n=1 Tax=Patiria miniata TaxID=46514 RepID=A0A914B0P1_PATMI|nr:uncharacterized protein LOC119738511 [Patiria miniata]